MNLDLKEKIEKEKTILELKGELDIFSSPTFKEKLYGIIENSQNDIILDLSEISYIDSTGLGVFVGALKKAKQKNLNIKLRNLKPNVKKVFSITGLDKVFLME